MTDAAAPDESAAARVERVVRGVIAAAVRDAGAAGVVVLADTTPEGELVCAWLTGELTAARVMRATVLADNVQCETDEEAQWLAAWRMAQRDRVLLVHPMNRTALLLGGPLPRADLLPLGDLYASQVERLTGGWSASALIETLAGAAGGVAALDAAISAWIDGRQDAGIAFGGMGPDVAAEVVRLYESGRYFRLRPRLVPKLGARTLGIDLWD